MIQGSRDIDILGSGLIRNLTAAGDDSFWVSTATESGMPVAVKYRLVDER